MDLKKFLLLSIISLSVYSVYSQNEKGDIDISATFSPLSSYGTDDIGLIATLGAEFFVLNKLSISGNFITSNNTILKNDSGTTIHSYSFMPAVQYYFLNNPKFNLFGHAGYGYGFEDLTRGTIENSALTLVSIGAGGNVKIGKSLYFKFLVPYFNAHNVTIDANAADGIGIFLGLNYKL